MFCTVSAVLEKVLAGGFLTNVNTILRKSAMKIVQRLGLTLLKTRVAAWRYVLQWSNSVFIWGGGVPKGGPDLHLGAAKKTRNEGCTLKSEKGGPWCEWGANGYWFVGVCFGFFNHIGFLVPPHV